MTTLIGTELRKLWTIRSPWLLLLSAQALIIVGASGLLLNANIHDRTCWLLLHDQAGWGHHLAGL